MKFLYNKYVIKIKLTNEILNDILSIEKNRQILSTIIIPVNLSNKFRKNTKKKSSYSSNKIEGNPLSYEQAQEVIDSDCSRHLLKPEQEIKNYYLAIEYLEKQLEDKKPISLDLILNTQKIICNGESKEKIGIRGPMPIGFIFAVYDEKTHQPEYIPPMAKDVIPLLTQLIQYINVSDDHPIIKSAVLHYQLTTIHPFEDGNGRTARILSNYLLSLYDYGFKNIGSLEEYFSYDINQYYKSLQMNLPVNYYDGRNEPPHSEIWFNYFLKIMKLYSSKVLEIASNSIKDIEFTRLNHLSKKALNFLNYLDKHNIELFIPIDIAKKLKVTNRTIINWSYELVRNGYLKPNLVNKRIRSYTRIK